MLRRDPSAFVGDREADLALDRGGLDADAAARRSDAQQAATGQEAVDLLGQLVRSNAIPPEQQPAFEQAFGALQQLSNMDAPPEKFDELGRILEQLPPMRGGGLAGVPHSPHSPALQHAVSSTIADGQMNMREFASVLRAMSNEVKRYGNNDATAMQVYEQGSALMMYLTQNAKIQPGQEQTFVAAANELGRLTQSRNASPREIDRLALQIEQGMFGP